MGAKCVLWVNRGGFLRADAIASAWRNTCRTAPAALQELTRNSFDAVVLQFPLPGWTAAALVREVRRLAPGVLVAIRDPENCLSRTVEWAQTGADRVLYGGADDSALLAQAMDRRTVGTRASDSGWESLLVGGSPEIRRVCQIIRLVGARRATVLITGETGTGKEIAARALHLAGPRGSRPLVAVNCNALPENLLEAELFGHVRGAFTGAVQSRIGRFEQADGGTLLLDEIGELPLDLQAKLLRVLQEREFQRLGSSESIRVDVRVVAATNCNLERRIEQGRFREDLYYRLNVVPLAMPPLRHRLDDIPLLATHFVEKVCRGEQIQLKVICSEALERLRCFDWPGNVRQLENAVEMAVALSGERNELTGADFPLPERAPTRLPPGGPMPLVSVPDTGLDYEQTLAWIERSILEQALRKTGGNKKAAAAMLRLKRTTLSAKVRNLSAPAA